MRVLFLAFFIAGCMSFDWQSGKLACGEEDACPTGMRCSDEKVCIDPDARPPAGSDSVSDSQEDTESLDSEHDSDSTEGTDSTLRCGDKECIPHGVCDAVFCDSQGGESVCAHQPAPEQCSAAKCGSVTCDTDDYSCKYLPVDEDCLGDEECRLARCESESEGEPPRCKTEVEEWLCDPGYVCSPANDYACLQGSCFEASVGKESQLSQLASKSYIPAIAKSDYGFAVVWVDGVSGGYGSLYISFLDHGGQPIPWSTKDVGVGTSVRNPDLVYLGEKQGFAVVFQGWNVMSKTHEIYLVLLDAAGGYDGKKYEISDVEGSHSYYASAAFHEGTGGVGVAWTDDRNKTDDGNVQKDIYATVFDVQQKYLVAGNQRVTDTANHEFWPDIVATPNGFVVAMQRKNEQLITTRKLGPNAVPLGALESIVPAGTATRPISMAIGDEDEIGIVWRDVTLGGSKPRAAFALLDQNGKLSTKMSEPVVVGGGLFSRYYQQEEIDYVGRFSLAWDGVRKTFVLAWDGDPTGESGHPDEAEILLTCISLADGAADSPWLVSANEYRSIMPSLIMDDGFGVVVWHDNRNNYNSDALDGEVYKSTFGSNN